MGFWSDSTQKDPKRAYRWVLRVGTIPAYTLKKVSKPSFTVSEVGHKYLNHTYYYPGRVEWNTVSMTIADPVAPDMAATIANIIKSSGYSPAQNPLDLGTMSKQKATTAMGEQIEIVQIDSNGEDVEVWTLVNPWIKDVKFGELDYESDEMTDVEIEVRYDWASLRVSNSPFEGGPSTDQTLWAESGGTSTPGGETGS